MTERMTPAQRLAISRALLADALQDPAWLILVQRWLKTSAKASAESSSQAATHTKAPRPVPPTPSQRPPGA
jgi:hypothetical protein